MSVMVAPERSMQQRMDALARANEVRVHRAQIKRAVKAGRICVVDLLVDPSGLETMKILELMLAVPGYARVKANKALRQCEVSPSKTLGGLTDRQRLAVAGWVRGER